MIQADEMVGEYLAGSTIRQIARARRTRPENVRRTLNENGVKIRAGRNRFNLPYTFNRQYFRSIDSHAKAYVLGLMYSDGHVNIDSDGASFCSVDLELMHFVQMSIGLTREIRWAVGAKNWFIQFHDAETKRDLIRLGCIPQKSLTKRFPTFEQVPEVFIDSFILGYFDGNGCISGDPQTQVKFASSESFCNGLAAYLLSKGLKLCKVTPDIRSKGFYLRITNRRSIVALRDLMCANHAFSLKRKRDRLYNVSYP